VKAILGALAKGSAASVYVLYGSESGLIRQVVDAIRKAVLEPGMEAFNHERFNGRELEGIGSVLDACSQLPVMAKLRLVELAEPDLVAKGKAEVAKASADALVEYLRAPSPTTVLVLTSSGLDGRSRLVTAVKKTGVVHKFEPLRRDRDAVDFVADHARASGLTLQRGAAQTLVELVGCGQSELVNALDRASLHAGAKAPITVADVEAVTSHTREAVIFELTDAVGMAQRDRALQVLAQIFHESSAGEIGQANQVMAMLIRQLRLVFVARCAGADPSRIEQAAGVPNFVARKLAQQARGFDEPRLRRAYAGLARLDRDLKGGSYAVARAPYMALQRWILDVCDALPAVAPRT
jgi:DNA polymerase III subunit delta